MINTPLSSRQALILPEDQSQVGGMTLRLAGATEIEPLTARPHAEQVTSRTPLPCRSGSSTAYRGPQRETAVDYWTLSGDTTS